jgi:hypothetical protein
MDANAGAADTPATSSTTGTAAAVAVAAWSETRRTHPRLSTVTQSAGDAAGIWERFTSGRAAFVVIAARSITSGSTASVRTAASDALMLKSSKNRPAYPGRRRLMPGESADGARRCSAERRPSQSFHWKRRRDCQRFKTTNGESNDCFDFHSRCRHSVAQPLSRACAAHS